MNIQSYTKNFNNIMLNSFQLRVARSVTGIEVREIALYLGISRTIISRWEKKTSLEEIKTKKVSPSSLVFFFKQHSIIFPDHNTVIFRSEKKPITSSHLSRFQLRAARAALRLTQEELAQETCISKSVINYLETHSNETMINSTNKVFDDLLFTDFFKSKGLLFPNCFSISYT